MRKHRPAPYSVDGVPVNDQEQAMEGFIKNLLPEMIKIVKTKGKTHQVPMAVLCDRCYNVAVDCRSCEGTRRSPIPMTELRETHPQQEWKVADYK